VGYSSANIQPLANRQYNDENFEPNIASILLSKPNKNKDFCCKK
jgi:hypothetical protein